MSRIKILNFGAIKEVPSGNEDWIYIKKVTIFIGNQGSGKSTIAKLISTFSWIEKVLTRGDFKAKEFTASKFRNTYCGYHGLKEYFIKGKTEIIYEGDSYKFTYNRNGEFIIEKLEHDTIYNLPQIMYVPAERNFISIVNKPNMVKDLPGPLITFMSEYDKAKGLVKKELNLPINNALLKYDKQSDTMSILGNDYKVKLSEASSGFQSIVPLYLVSLFLSSSIKEQSSHATNMSHDEAKRFEEEVTNIWSNTNLTDEQRRIALSTISYRFNKSAFINIVEEPEQNLFPESQWKMMQSLLAFNNELKTNRLIITTHSPYLINSITIAAKVGKMKETQNYKLNQLNNIFPTNSSISPDDLAIYELDESSGTYSQLSTFEGLPSDENYLNMHLDKFNDIFANLLELQQAND